MRYKPMLAYPVSQKPINWDEGKLFIQPKLDGTRCLIQYEDGEVTAYTRTGKVWKNVYHITETLKSFFKENPNVVLDGELYNHDLKDDFEKIISLVRKTKPTLDDKLESGRMVQFHCYDIVDHDKTFSERNRWLKLNLSESFCVKHVETLWVVSESKAKYFHQSNLGEGYEGSILRTDDVYQSKRTHSLRKFKDFSDAEATIVGYVEGIGKRTGTLGKFLMKDDDGIEFGCPPGKGYSYKDLADILANIDDYIGKRATFTFFERTKANSYRHPLYKCIRDYE